jgi:hypothetical protein
MYLNENRPMLGTYDKRVIPSGLLGFCTFTIVYTPVTEHFGILPSPRQVRISNQSILLGQK